jgi:hypothetical protein
MTASAHKIYSGPNYPNNYFGYLSIVFSLLQRIVAAPFSTEGFSLSLMIDYLAPPPKPFATRVLGKVTRNGLACFNPVS